MNFETKPYTLYSVIHDVRRARSDSKVLARSCRNVGQRETDIRTMLPLKH